MPSKDAPRPHIISILQDDLGWWDSGIHNPEVALWSRNISDLQKVGITLDWHYTHWHCSPSRRSFLTGRLPIHHGEQLSEPASFSDDIDLRMAWISDKLAGVGYSAHWFGKMHTGFRSMAHLPINHGFSNQSMGSLDTGGAYSGPARGTRFQGNHSVWEDTQFIDPPPHIGCAQVPFDARRQMRKKRKHATQSVTEQSECGATWSDELWGQLALRAIKQHDLSSGPLFVHLCFESVHSPWENFPPGFPKCSNDDGVTPTGDVCTGKGHTNHGRRSTRVYKALLWHSDVVIGQIVALLKQRGMFDNTLILYASDNGGHLEGNNYPLRGEKHSNWEGAMRTVALVSGGFIPAHLRGTRNNHTVHIVDWYATFAALAGAEPTDNPPVAVLPVDVSRPLRNIYGDRSFPPVDGTNIWPILTAPHNFPRIDAAHPDGLVLSKEVIIAGHYKLIVGQPHFKEQACGWKNANGSWTQCPGNTSRRQLRPACEKQSKGPKFGILPVPYRQAAIPCLFDLRDDPREERDLSGKFPGLVSKLWAQLNETVASTRDCSGWSYNGNGGNIPGPEQKTRTGRTGCSPPYLLGACNKTCAMAAWHSRAKTGGSDSTEGPTCGVPGCLRFGAL